MRSFGSRRPNRCISPNTRITLPADLFTMMTTMKSIIGTSTAKKAKCARFLICLIESIQFKRFIALAVLNSLEVGIQKAL
jgi:hypothetical protein